MIEFYIRAECTLKLSVSYSLFFHIFFCSCYLSLMVIVNLVFTNLSDQCVRFPNSSIFLCFLAAFLQGSSALLTKMSTEAAFGLPCDASLLLPTFRGFDERHGKNTCFHTYQSKVYLVFISIFFWFAATILL